MSGLRSNESQGDDGTVATGIADERISQPQAWQTRPGATSDRKPETLGASLDQMEARLIRNGLKKFPGKNGVQKTRDTTSQYCTNYWMGLIDY